VSPRRFDRRTYMIVAPGWSALAFNAAMRASSASTTIRSAFPFTRSPTVNCHDIFGLPRSYATNERSPASNDTLRANSISLCVGLSRRSQRANSVTPAQGTSIKVKDKSFNLTALAKRNSSDDIQSFKVSGSYVYSTITCAYFSRT